MHIAQRIRVQRLAVRHASVKITSAYFYLFIIMLSSFGSNFILWRCTWGDGTRVHRIPGHVLAERAVRRGHQGWRGGCARGASAGHSAGHPAAHARQVLTIFQFSAQRQHFFRDTLGDVGDEISSG